MIFIDFLQKAYHSVGFSFLQSIFIVVEYIMTDQFFKLVCLCGVLLLGISILIVFFRSHRDFKARLKLYESLYDRIEKGEEILLSDLEKLTPDDREGIKLLMGLNTAIQKNLVQVVEFQPDPK